MGLLKLAHAVAYSNHVGFGQAKKDKYTDVNYWSIAKLYPLSDRRHRNEEGWPQLRVATEFRIASEFRPARGLDGW
jgi:hypothetical protein